MSKRQNKIKNVKSEKNIVLDINDPSNFYFTVQEFARPLLDLEKKNQKGDFWSVTWFDIKILRFFISNFTIKNILIKKSMIWLRSGLRRSHFRAEVPILTDDKNPLIFLSLSTLFLDHLMHTHTFFFCRLWATKWSMTWRSWREIKIRAKLLEWWPLVKTRFSLMNKRIHKDRLLHKGQTVHWIYNFKGNEGSLEQVFYALSEWSNFFFKKCSSFWPLWSIVTVD